MSRRKQSELLAIDATTGANQTRALDTSRILFSSRGLAWDGVIAESGMTPSFAADGLAMSGHCVVVNLHEQPLALEQRHSTRRFERVHIPPHGIRITPAHFPINIRKSSVDHWGCVMIDAATVDALVGRAVDPRPEIVGIDAPLYAATIALLSEARGRGSSGSLFVEGLAIAIASQLARRAGSKPGRTARGGLGGRRMKLVSDRIDEGLAGSLTIDELARVAELSPAHFAREFKRHTRQTPHEFIMRRRLERARGLLVQGLRGADVARLCGFADQSHLSRRFTEHFGVNPAAFVRTYRSE